ARLKFDEFRRKPQNCSTMKSFSVLLVFILAAFSAVAQTDTNAVTALVDTNAIVVPTDTNAPASQPGTKGIAAQTETNTNGIQTNTMTNAATRQMSLEDCIQEALQHNLDVQISRYTPQIQLYTVRADYGGY